MNKAVRDEIFTRVNAVAVCLDVFEGDVCGIITMLDSFYEPPTHRELGPHSDEAYARVGELRALDYRTEYLASPEWRARREDALRIAGNRCQGCNKSVGLDVHHRTYENLGEEGLPDLVALCRDCHSAIHEHGGWKR